MKKAALIAVAALVFLAEGCGAQVASGPTPSTCPSAVVNGTAYAPLNPASNLANPPTAALDYTDAAVSPGTWCYIVQSWVSPNASGPSNVVMITVPSGDDVVLNWEAPPGASGYDYIVSRVQATPGSLPLTPADLLGTPAVGEAVKPALNPPSQAQLAYAPKAPVLRLLISRR